MFVGADGFDCETGITTFNEGYAISGVMAEAARQVVVVSDSSKFGRKGFNTVLSIDRIDTIVTDKNAPEDAIKRLKSKGKKVIIV